jgi:type IV pilus assembly protein PilA
MRKRRQQSGFTIVEMIIVVCIIAILASVAINSAREYSRRAKMSEVVLALSTCKTAVAENYPVLDVAPDAGNWGCETSGRTFYSAGVQTSSRGVIRMKIQNMDTLDGNYVYLVPAKNDGVTPLTVSDIGGGVRAWICGSDFQLVRNSLPANCRVDTLSYSYDDYGP